MDPSTCPDQTLLAALAAGDLSGSPLEAVARHVDLCPPCQARLRASDAGGDPLFTGPCRSGAVTPYLHEPECFRGIIPEGVVPGAAGLPAQTGAGPEPPMAALPSGPRFRVVRFHAKGGLGEVHLAQDEELHRPVALKRLQRGRASDFACRRRFHREAEITGRLEHPGIVPVYGLTRDDEGQPGYVMRFIQGETLHEAIRRLHQTGRDTPEHRLGLRQLLQRFIVVCNTVAYAHSHGVIHRDLKPANIMLGPYGETLIVDWGLAKQLDREPRSQGDKEINEHPVGVADAPEQTQAGQALGTPAYMSPEQAAGSWESVGPASDLYSLGATLYTLLTGQAPFADDPGPALVEEIRHGAFPRPRLRQAGVPRALEAVCLKAMALAPQDRYATPLELAADVEHWLADEPVAAYPDGWLARGRRWVKRHRPLVAGLTAAVVVAGVLVVGAWLWRIQTRAEIAQAVTQALHQARQQCYQGNLGEALVEARRAEALLEGAGGSESLHHQVEVVLADLAMVKRLEDVRLHQAGGKEGPVDPAGVDAAYAAAFARYGIAVEQLPPAEAVRRIQACAIRDHLVTALDYWARVRRGLHADDTAGWRRLQEIARAADTDPWRRRHAEGYYHLGEVLEKQRRWDEAVTAYRQAVRLDPDYAEAHGNLGAVLNLTNRLDEAVAACQTALRLKPDLASAQLHLGQIFLRKRQMDAAIQALRRAVDLAPDAFEGYVFLGQALLKKELPREAAAACRTAIRLKPNNAAAYAYLGNALLLEGQVDQAIDALRTAVRYRPDYPEAYYDLGHALLLRDRPDQALTALDQAIRLKLPGPEVHCDRGDALVQLGRLEEAIPAYQRAIAVKKNYAEAYCKLGRLLQWQGHFAQALTALQRGHALGSRNPRWALPSAQWLRQCQRGLELEAKLPEVLAGAVEPAGATEWAEFAWLCLLQRRYVPAVHCLRMAGAAAADALRTRLRSDS